MVILGPTFPYRKELRNQMASGEATQGPAMAETATTPGLERHKEEVETIHHEPWQEPSGELQLQVNRWFCRN
jgi:hypothetical protein